MTQFDWPKIRDDAVKLVPVDHPNIARVVEQVLNHARAGRSAFLAKRFVEAKYHRDCCGLHIWRLGVDGLTAKGEIRWDGAKYETRLPGRLSSKAARDIRESEKFRNRKQSALENSVACDHVAPRSCVADVLIRPGWWDTEDEESGTSFLLAHGEVAILAPHEDGQLDDAELKSDMPSEWWNADLAGKKQHIQLRYQRAGIVVARWPDQISGEQP